MSSDTAIPQLTDDVPGGPRELTRTYFDGGKAFGTPHARPALTAAVLDRTWDAEQLLDAAHVGAAGRELHPDILAALCARYVDLAQAELALVDVGRQLAAAQGVAAGLQDVLTAERRAHRGTTFAREYAEALYVTELEERNRVARLHAEVSERLAIVTQQRDQAHCERILALHARAGTTPAGIAIALDRAVRAATSVGLDDRLDGREAPDSGDTLVMHLEDLHPAGMGVGCG